MKLGVCLAVLTCVAVLASTTGVARGPDYIPDHAEAEQALLQAVGDGDAVRVALSQDALWTASSSVGSTLPEHAVAAVS